MVINLTLLSVMIVAALLTVFADSLLKSTIGLAVVSAAVAALLFRLNGPLAGVFELSVCAGLITAVFATTISLTKPANYNETAARGKIRLKKYWPLPLLMIAAGFLVWKFLKLPATPSLPFALEPNGVRNILWNVRHIDILGQIAIVLLGAFGVVVLFRGVKKP
jgi:NADH-quinone oxidoreductase subunit J